MPQATDLGDRVRSLRAMADPLLSARELAKLAGLPSAAVGLIEHGSNENPKLRTLQSIADVFGVSIEWLGNGQGRAPNARHVTQAVQAARARSERRPTGTG